jgi:hypothetical protein
MKKHIWGKRYDALLASLSDVAADVRHICGRAE